MDGPAVTDHAFVKTAWTRNCAHLASLEAERCNLPPERHWSAPPPWWQWFDPPSWFPSWLHKLTCTHCRGLRAYGRDLRSKRRTS